MTREAAVRVDLVPFERACREAARMLVALGAAGPLPPSALAELPPDLDRFEVVGLGGSEGPARLLVATLAQGGLWACYTPLVELLRPDARRSQRTLMVVSQGLSPNARFALSRASAFRQTVLVTSTRALSSSHAPAIERFQAQGGIVVDGPVPDEPSALVRLAGPVCMAMVGVRWAHSLLAAQRRAAYPDRELSSVGAGYERGLLNAAELLPGTLRPEAPLAFVSSLPWLEVLRAELGKWREALGREVPPAFDGFGFVHGALQSLAQREGWVLLVGSSAAAERALRARLRQCLERSEHHAVELEVELSSALGLFEAFGFINGWVLRAAHQLGIDPCAWYGQTWDEPVYALDDPSALEREASGP